MSAFRITIVDGVATVERVDGEQVDERIRLYQSQLSRKMAIEVGSGISPAQSYPGVEQVGSNVVELDTPPGELHIKLGSGNDVITEDIDNGFENFASTHRIYHGGSGDDAVILKGGFYGPGFPLGILAGGASGTLNYPSLNLWITYNSMEM